MATIFKTPSGTWKALIRNTGCPRRPRHSEPSATLEIGCAARKERWKPVVEQRLGQQVAAKMSRGSTSWEIG